MSVCLSGQKTIVATMDRSIRDTNSMDLVLESIFKGTKFAELRLLLASHLQKSGHDQTFNEVFAETQTVIVEKIASIDTSADQIALYREALRSLMAHYLKVSESATAYAPSSKINPGAVFWPNPEASGGKSVLDELPFVQATPILDKSTPIGSAGSCFASEISTHLTEQGYNYVITEPNNWSSAGWGGLFNTPSFRQLAEFAFGLRKRPKLLFSCDETGKTELWDPYREGVFFESVSQYEEGLQKHLDAARDALTKSKVFVMTVGLNEVWRLCLDDSVIARYPRSLASHLVYNEVLTVQQNVQELQRFADIVRAHNPDVKLIITVSPIPMYATFRANECHVVTATCHAKAVLRVAVEEFVKANPGMAYYFPAYETVTYCSLNPFIDDGRHVSRDAVAKVMQLFKKTFVKEVV